MENLVIVSNRLPIQVKFENSKLTLSPSVGGLATGLSSIHPKDNSLWVGWTGIAEEEIPYNEVKDELIEKVIWQHCIPVSLT